MEGIAVTESVGMGVIEGGRGGSGGNGPSGNGSNGQNGHKIGWYMK